jgi:hypothetical protein
MHAISGRDLTNNPVCARLHIRQLYGLLRLKLRDVLDPQGECCHIASLLSEFAALAGCGPDSQA